MRTAEPAASHHHALARRRLVTAAGLAALLPATLSGAASTSPADPFKDPLDRPATRTTRLTTTPINALARTGGRLVAAGLRGHVIVSDDAGLSWQQAAVPVASDLTSVLFTTPQLGWVTGHDGVLLHSRDSGATWVKRLDGRMTAQALTKHFETLAANGDREAPALLDAVKQNYAAGPEQALLGVAFTDARTGWACGSFGTLLATQDGGETWQSWMERIDNPKLLHLNAIAQIGGQVLIASEQGTVFRLDAQRQRFVGRDADVIAYGLRGTVFRSRDGGNSWSRLPLNLSAGLNGGTVFDDGTLALVSQDGRVLLSKDRGDNFRPLAVPQPGLFTSIAHASAGSAAVGGLAGVNLIALR
jgi:photosystem II stability/assembly factor-like uncharacterized protein